MLAARTPEALFWKLNTGATGVTVGPALRRFQHERVGTMLECEVPCQGYQIDKRSRVIGAFVSFLWGVEQATTGGWWKEVGGGVRKNRSRIEHSSTVVASQEIH